MIYWALLSFATTLGLREKHYLLDIGCGSLWAGRLCYSLSSFGSLLQRRAEQGSN